MKITDEEIVDIASITTMINELENKGIYLGGSGVHVGLLETFLDTFPLEETSIFTIDLPNALYPYELVTVRNGVKFSTLLTKKMAEKIQNSKDMG